MTAKRLKSFLPASSLLIAIPAAQPAGATGLGVEYAFAPNWSAKLEYDHVGYLSRNVDLGTLSADESATTSTVKAGVNYKFFRPSGAVVARD